VRLLADQGKTIFISSHILSELGDMCDHLLFIDAEKLVYSGSMESLVDHHGLQTLLFLMPLHGFSALHAEIKSATLELVFLTHFSAWRIAAGKWTALMVQTLALDVMSEYVVFLKAETEMANEVIPGEVLEGGGG